MRVAYPPRAKIRLATWRSFPLHERERARILTYLRLRVLFCEPKT